jgi:hypothetical protein
VPSLENTSPIGGGVFFDREEKMAAASESKLPVDPNVKMPRAVLAAQAASDAAYKAQFGQAPNDPNVTQVVPPTPPDKPVPTPPKVEQSFNQPPFTQPGNEPTPLAPAAPVENGSPEQQVSLLQGRLRKANETIKQQQGTISELQNRVSNVENLMAQMQAQPPVQQPNQVPRELRAESLITPEERAAYGDDFMDVMSRVAQQQNQNLLTEVQSLKQQLGNVSGHMVQGEREKMKEALTVALPNWREQNHDASFLAWLRLPDPFSGVNRGELLKDAWDRNVTPRVLSIFKGYLAESGELTEHPTAPAGNGRPSLESFASPGRAKVEATPQGGPSNKPIITRAQIAQFYAEVRAGRYNGRDKEKNEAEQMIFSAEREGRIK